MTEQPPQCCCRRHGFKTGVPAPGRTLEEADITIPYRLHCGRPSWGLSCVMLGGSRRRVPHSTPGTVKLWVPPRQSRGVSPVYARARRPSGGDRGNARTTARRRRMEPLLARTLPAPGGEPTCDRERRVCDGHDRLCAAPDGRLARATRTQTRVGMALREPGHRRWELASSLAQQAPRPIVRHWTLHARRGDGVRRSRADERTPRRQMTPGPGELILARSG